MQRGVFDGNDAVDAMIAATGTDAATGTAGQVAEKLRGIRDLGCGYAILYFPDGAYDRSGIELFERDILPALAR